MTKKSDARVAKDANKAAVQQELKGNNNWTDLHRQHAISLQLICAPGAIARALNNPDLLACMKDLDTFNTNVRTLTSDIKAFSVDLDTIYARHKDRTGHADETNIMEAFGIVDAYAGFNVRYETVMLPTILHILEQTNEAEKEMGRLQALIAASRQTAEVPVTQPV